MQTEYYRSPCRGNAPPTGEGRPCRRRGRLVLILFLALIVLSAAGLSVVRILSWDISPDIFVPQGPSLFEDEPGGFYGSFVNPPEQSGRITIPRADPVSGVELRLSELPVRFLSFQEIYEKVAPSIVSIQASGDAGAYEGTGVIMTRDGYVITNHHIIAGCSSAQVVLSDGTLYDARLAGSDAESDLALLKVDAADLTAAEFGNSDLLRVGDDVLAIGNPLGSELFGTMTEGIISAMNRDVNVDGYDMSLLQTTAALNPGNSGGALINGAGQVIGITNMKMMSDYETIEGLGFAIPTTWVKEVVDVLLAQGAVTGRPTIGFTCFTVTGEMAEFYGHTGVCIESVTAGGPADEAGVQPDDIIIEANGRSIAGLEDLTAVRDEAGVGGTLTLTIWRGGEIIELTLTLIDQYELN